MNRKQKIGNKIMKNLIILTIIFSIGYCSGNIDGKKINLSYEKGYKTGVECRGMLSAPSCLLILEKTK